MASNAMNQKRFSNQQPISLILDHPAAIEWFYSRIWKLHTDKNNFRVHSPTEYILYIPIHPVPTAASLHPQL